MNEKLSQKELFWPLLIMGLGLLVYGHSLANGFFLDDVHYVQNNPSITSLSGLAKMWSFPAIPYYDNPVTLTFFWLEHKLWGFNPWGYHCINLTFHLLNALLLYGLVLRLKPIVAGVTAVLFTIHPIQVETVVWISELKNLLCLFFFFLALHNFLDFEKSGPKKPYIKMLLFFTASILSKFTGVCFVAIPFLYAWAKRQTIHKRTIFLTLPFFFLGALSILIPIHVQNAASTDLAMPLFPDNITLAGRLFFFYIKQILLPWKFLTLYPHWDISARHPANWIYPLGVLSLYTTFYCNRERWGRGAFTLLCFYGISIFPALGFFKITLFSTSYGADHFTYLSVPPLLFLICNAGHSSLLKIHAFLTQAPVLLKRSLAIIIITYLALSSYRLTLNYKDRPTVWFSFLKQAPESPFGYYFMGAEILRISPEKAIPFFEKAISLKADFFKAYEGLGVTYLKVGATEKAILAFREGVRLKPENKAARENLETAKAALAKSKANN